MTLSKPPLSKNLSPQDPLGICFRSADVLSDAPLDPEILLDRAEKYRILGYADLAVADAYYVITLVETAVDPDFSDLLPECEVEDGGCISWPAGPDAEGVIEKTKIRALHILVECLAKLGCLRDACTYFFQLRGYTAGFGNSALDPVYLKCFNDEYQRVKPDAAKIETTEELEKLYQSLQNSGFAHREAYPWNEYEPDRTSSESLQTINNRLQINAPNLEARATNLPVLGEAENQDTPTTCIQLGLFAHKDLAPNSTILQERSIITAIRPIDASLCDLCASPLPELSSSTSPVACPECSTTVFCSQKCLEFAATNYHKPPFCGNDDGLDEIGRDANSRFPADDLYFLLVARTIAMAEAQDLHPLELFETKYLCGEFVGHKSSPSLPFTFTHNILLPFRFFTTLMLSDESVTPYSSKWVRRYDHWVIQTLFAKFRGVASARQSTWDAKPEVAAVHPLWCLANHSCSPNVRWQWGGDVQDSAIRYTVREDVAWRDPGRVSVEYLGIRKDEEIMNHYVDVELPVRERREYAMGPLGGECRCERCIWESRDDENRTGTKLSGSRRPTS